jgi:hypothetical protein
MPTRNEPKPAKPKQAKPDLTKVRAMWAELHRRAASTDPLDADAERVWIDDFTKRVPCGECKQHWRMLLKEVPPDLSSRDAYFAWGVTAHNAINVRLGKPQVSVDEARRLWTPT